MLGLGRCRRPLLLLQHVTTDWPKTTQMCDLTLRWLEGSRVGEAEFHGGSRRDGPTASSASRPASPPGSAQLAASPLQSGRGRSLSHAAAGLALSPLYLRPVTPLGHLLIQDTLPFSRPFVTPAT